MTLELFFQAIIKIASGIMLTGILIFLPAGTLNFPQGWLLMALLFVPMFFAGIILMIKNPALLKRRLNAKEPQKEQRLVVILSAIMFIIGFIIAGLDFRFGWSNLPACFVIAGVILFLSAYLMYAEVIRENTYLSRTIEVSDGQRVICSGLYSVVRHPMYSATLILFLSMPLILGSVYSLIIFAAYPFIIAGRIKYEEQFLIDKLTGYNEYTKKVKYKLLPFIW